MVSLPTDNWFSFHAEMIRSLALIFHDDIDAEFCIVIAQLLSSAIKLRDGLYICILNSTKVCYYNLPLALNDVNFVKASLVHKGQ